MAAIWAFVALLALGAGLGAWALVRGAGGTGRAQSILAERLARGDLTPDDYRERLALIGVRSASRRWFIPVGVSLIILGLVGTVTAGGIAMGRGEMGWMMGDGMTDMGEMMMGGESGRRGNAPQEGARERQVEAMDFSFNPSNVRIPVDEAVNIVFHNAGASYHTFTVKGLDFELRAQGDEEIAGSLRASRPARYSAICTVPGHERMGMSATVIVEEKGQRTHLPRGRGLRVHGVYRWAQCGPHCSG